MKLTSQQTDQSFKPFRTISSLVDTAENIAKSEVSADHSMLVRSNGFLGLHSIPVGTSALNLALLIPKAFSRCDCHGNPAF